MMTNFYDEMTKALDQHRQLERSIENNANALAQLLERNLRHVSPWRLKVLKRALRDFNMNTGRWNHGR